MATKKQRKGDTKRCSRCGEFRELAEFPRNRAMADGYAVYCRACKRIAERERTAAPAKGTKAKPSASNDGPLTVPALRPAPKPGARGPQSTITTNLIEQITQVLRRGHTRRTAARKCGVLEDTFAQWMKRGAEEESGPTAEFHRAVLEAEGEGEHALVELVRDSAEIDAQQAKWLLERRYSQGAETWVRKEHIDVTTGPEMPEVSVVRELILSRLKGLGGSGPNTPVANVPGGDGRAAAAPVAGGGDGNPAVDPAPPRTEPPSS